MFRGCANQFICQAQVATRQRNEVPPALESLSKVFKISDHLPISQADRHLNCKRRTRASARYVAPEDRQ